VGWIKLEASCETVPNKLSCEQLLDQLNNSQLFSKDSARMRWSEFQIFKLLAIVLIKITKIPL
jgi:hypothetical protein